MTIKNSILFLLGAFLFAGCTREYDCADSTIQTAFIGFSSADIDTLVLRKFKANDNYQHIIDSFLITYGYSGHYQTSGDTTTVFVADGKNGIKQDYDWQIFIPAMNKTVFVSEIVGENRTGKCGSGLFSMDKFGCTCTNNIFSAKKDNQLINFSNSGIARHSLFIRN